MFDNSIDPQLMQAVSITQKASAEIWGWLMSQPNYKRKSGMRSLLENLEINCTTLAAVTTCSRTDLELASDFVKQTSNVSDCLGRYGYTKHADLWATIVGTWQRAHAYYVSREPLADVENPQTLFSI